MAIVCELLRSGVITRSQLEFHRQQIRGSRNLRSQSTVNGGSLPFPAPLGLLRRLKTTFCTMELRRRTFSKRCLLFCQWNMQHMKLVLNSIFTQNNSEKLQSTSIKKIAEKHFWQNGKLFENQNPLDISGIPGIIKRSRKRVKRPFERGRRHFLAFFRSFISFWQSITGCSCNLLIQLRTSTKFTQEF